MIDSIRKVIKRALSPRTVRNVLSFILLAATEAGLIYVGLMFFRADFLALWFRIILIASDVLFMLGFAWLINRYIFNN